MDIIERIKKLYALSARNNSTEEAAAAAAKIQELCFKHNLELEQVLKETGQEKQPYVKFDYEMPATTRTDVGWKRSLFHAVCKANFCSSVYFPNSTRMAVVGQKQNFDVVVYEFEYLVREIQRLAVQACVKQAFFVSKEKRRYIAGFCEGAMSSVYRKLTATYQQQAQQSSESRALVVVKDKELSAAVKVHFPHLRHTSRRATGSNSGYSDGKTAGQNITVNRGVGSTSRGLLN